MFLLQQVRLEIQSYFCNILICFKIISKSWGLTQWGGGVVSLQVHHPTALLS